MKFAISAASVQWNFCWFEQSSGWDLIAAPAVQPILVNQTALRYCSMTYDQYTLGMAYPARNPRRCANVRNDLKSKTPTKRRSRAVEPGDGTLTDRAYRELEEMIVTLQLSPGTVLSEQALAVRLKIGRTPIREALQRLARDGLVVIMPRRGIMVSEINLRLQLRLLEVRRELERLMASLAAERATAEERREFAEVGQAMLAAAAKADDIAFMRLDQRFNILIATAARNEFARRSMGLMNALSRRFWYQHYQEVADLPLAAKLHAAVAEAVAQKKVKAAAAASDQLIDYIEDFARKTLDS
jgi:DNA-binding GntR family transcriptional regulator